MQYLFRFLVLECGVHGQYYNNIANLQCCCSAEADTGLIVDMIDSFYRRISLEPKKRSQHSTLTKNADKKHGKVGHHNVTRRKKESLQQNWWDIMQERQCAMRGVCEH